MAAMFSLSKPCIRVWLFLRGAASFGSDVHEDPFLPRSRRTWQEVLAASGKRGKSRQETTCVADDMLDFSLLEGGGLGEASGVEPECGPAEELRGHSKKKEASRIRRREVEARMAARERQEIREMQERLDKAVALTVVEDPALPSAVPCVATQSELRTLHGKRGNIRVEIRGVISGLHWSGKRAIFAKMRHEAPVGADDDAGAAAPKPEPEAPTLEPAPAPEPAPEPAPAPKNKWPPPKKKLSRAQARNQPKVPSPEVDPTCFIGAPWAFAADAILLREGQRLLVRGMLQEKARRAVPTLCTKESPPPV